MSEKEVFNLNSKNLGKVSGGKSASRDVVKPTAIPEPIVGGPGGIWRPKCPSCGKEMPGGEGVVRIHKEGVDSPYFCTECAEKLLNSGEAIIDPGYEKYYKKYEKSMNETTGEIWYGWEKIK